MELIDKSAVVAEIEKFMYEANQEADIASTGECFDEKVADAKYQLCKQIRDSIDSLEVKEVNLNNGIQLTWEDIRELYIIFAEVDVDIELCKTADIQAETIGYYQEVLKRFKSQKGE